MVEEGVLELVVSFTIPGEPKGKARPRVFKNKYTGKSQAVTPADTVAYENLVRHAYKETDSRKLEGMLMAQIEAFYSIPKSMTKKKRELICKEQLYPVKRPDLDNIAKIVLDALNGVAYNDDAQVVYLQILKAYSEKPRVQVVLKELEEAGEWQNLL
jgi:Holliday junction resolvase RusA-like endonuclease